MALVEHAANELAIKALLLHITSLSGDAVPRSPLGWIASFASPTEPGGLPIATWGDWNWGLPIATWGDWG